MVAEQQNSEESLPEEQAVASEATPPGTVPGPEVQSGEGQPDALQQELEHLKKQAQDNLDTALRAQAELDNVRKRSLRDVENAHKYALEKFANELLPVIDSMELGISAAGGSNEENSLKEGMELTLQMFRSVLEKFGVVEVESEAQKFDPEKHEAVSMQEVEGCEPGTVVNVLQKGYSLNGRLVRPAMVVVAK